MDTHYYEEIILNSENVSTVKTFYHFLKTLNVSLPDKVEFEIASKIVGNNFYSTISSESTSEKVTLDEIREVIDHTVELVTELEKSSDKESTFIFISRLVAINLQFLKTNLKCTYNRIPWEEMQFCIVYLIHVLQSSKKDIVYLVLDEERLLSHLKLFIDILTNISGSLKAKDVSAESRLGNRSKNIQQIQKANPNFKQLFRDYNLIRDVYSLNRIQFYIQETLKIDFTVENNIINKLIMERSLQVIGECLKNTPVSPNMSHGVHEILTRTVSKELEDVITSLRDCLSHSETFMQKRLIEEEYDQTFFQNLQKDLQVLNTGVTDVFNKRIYYAFLEFLVKIENCHDLHKIRRMIDKMIEIGVRESIFRPVEFNFLDEIENRCVQFENNENLTKGEQNFLNELKNLISKSTYFISSKHEYFFSSGCAGEVVSFQKFIETLRKSVSLNVIHLLVRDFYINLSSNYSEYHSLLDEIKNKVIGLINSVDENTIHTLEMRTLILKITCLCVFARTKITNIKNMRNVLKDDKSLKLHRNEISKLWEITKSSFKTEKDQSKFLKLIEKNIVVHETKLDLFDSLEQKAPVSVISELVKNLKLKKSIEDDFLLKYSNDDYKFCKIFISKISDPYGIFLKNVNASNLEIISKRFFIEMNIKPEQVEKILEEFKTQNLSKIRLYFLKRLEILTELFSSGSDNKTDFDKVTYFKNNKQFQIATELLLLDILNILEENSRFIKDTYFFVSFAPLLTGKPLRNYLAHGNFLLDNLEFDTSLSIICNAIKIMQEKLDLLDKKNVILGHRSSKSDMKDYYKTILSAILEDCGIRSKESFDDRLWLYIAGMLNNDQNYGWYKFKDGYTLLHLAAECDKKDITELLIKRHFDINAVSSKNVTPLYLAAQSNNYEIVGMLLKSGADQTIAEDEGHTPLHIAAALNNFQSCCLLLEDNDDQIDSVTKTGFTPLHLACKNGFDQTASVLLNRGANINLQTPDGVTALYLSVQNKHTNIVSFLLENQADVNLTCKNGYNVLHLVALRGNLEICKLLIKNGANLDSRIDKSQNAVHLAAMNQQNEILGFLLDLAPSIIDSVDNNHNSALYFAAAANNVEGVEILLNHNANIEITNNFAMTPLHIACLTGSISVVEKLLSRNCNLHIKNENGFSGLHVAVLSCNFELIKLLLERGISVNHTGKENTTALYVAVQSGFVDIVKLLLEYKADTEIGITEMCTPLHAACKGGYEDIVEILLDNAANIEAKTTQGFTPLHLASSKGHNIVVGILLKRKANVNSVTTENATPLFLAVKNDRIDTVKNLLNHDADFEVGITNGCTPLHVASIYNLKDIVEILINKKCSIDTICNSRYTALLHAACYGHSEIVKILVESGADLNYKGIEGATSLFIAIENQHTETARDLLELNADFTLTNDFHAYPIQMACQRGLSGIVEILIQKGADINCIFMNEYTLMHIACQCDQMSVVEVLIKYHVNINSLTSDHFTPLYLASSQNNELMVRFLLQNGADANIPDNLGLTPVHVAAKLGYCKIVKILIKEMSDDSFKNSHDSLLHLSVSGGNVEIVELVLNRFNNFKNCKDSEGDTPLMWAVEKKNINMVNFLLDFNCDLNLQNLNGYTVLHWAVSVGDLDLIKLLSKQSSCNKRITNNDGETALDLFLKKNITSGENVGEFKQLLT